MASALFDWMCVCVDTCDPILAFVFLTNNKNMLQMKLKSCNFSGISDEVGCSNEEHTLPAKLDTWLTHDCRPWHTRSTSHLPLGKPARKRHAPCLLQIA